MERVMSVEEKIRRAEEIYQRRKQGEVRPVAKVAVNNEKKDVKLLKKMIIQILICIAIYLVVYIIQNNTYVFSEDFLNKANEILSYDTNFMELYECVKDKIMNWQKTSDGEAIGGAVEEETSNEEISEEPVEQEQPELQQDVVTTENLSPEEINIQNIKNTTSFIKPVEGVVSSKYGQRDNATGSVPKNHTGTDIAANLGTKIISATDGEVVLSSEEGDYRKAFKNSNWGGKYNLCTL